MTSVPPTAGQPGGGVPEIGAKTEKPVANLDDKELDQRVESMVNDSKRTTISTPATKLFNRVCGTIGTLLVAATAVAARNEQQPMTPVYGLVAGFALLAIWSIAGSTMEEKAYGGQVRADLQRERAKARGPAGGGSQ